MYRILVPMHDKQLGVRLGLILFFYVHTEPRFIQSLSLTSPCSPPTVFCLFLQLSTHSLPDEGGNAGSPAVPRSSQESTTGSVGATTRPGAYVPASQAAVPVSSSGGGVSSAPGAGVSTSAAMTSSPQQQQQQQLQGLQELQAQQQQPDGLQQVWNGAGSPAYAAGSVSEVGLCTMRCGVASVGVVTGGVCFGLLACGECRAYRGRGGTHQGSGCPPGLVSAA